jgi:hypothetical protein
MSKERHRPMSTVLKYSELELWPLSLASVLELDYDHQ